MESVDHWKMVDQIQELQCKGRKFKQLKLEECHNENVNKNLSTSFTQPVLLQSYPFDPSRATGGATGYLVKGATGALWIC